MSDDEAQSHIHNPISDYFGELKKYKHLFRSVFTKYFFGKYRNSYLGFLWHFVSPLIYLILLFIVSTEIKGRTVDFIVLLASGVFAYHMLLNGVTSGTTCFSGAASMIKKMYFPREILVYIHVLISFFVSMILYAILLVIMAIIGFGFNPVALLWFPVIIFLIMIFATGCSLLLSSIAVYIRDIQYALASITIIFFVLTPLRDSLDNFTGLRGELMRYNPFTYYIEPIHSIFYYQETPELWMISICCLVSVIFLVAGIIVFNKLKRGFAERL